MAGDKIEVNNPDTSKKLVKVILQSERKGEKKQSRESLCFHINF